MMDVLLPMIVSSIIVFLDFGRYEVMVLLLERKNEPILKTK